MEEAVLMISHHLSQIHPLTPVEVGLFQSALLVSCLVDNSIEDLQGNKCTYCKFGNFRETSHMRSFVKMKSPRNDETTLSLTDVGKS